MYTRFIIIIALFCMSNYALAVREFRPTPIDSRIKVIVYSADDVFKFTGYYGFQTMIELSKDEEVTNISMGDTTSWQIVPKKNIIFIKPIEFEATTNMTLMTNKRTYFFELYAEETQDIRDPNIAFNVKFIYPDEEDENLRTSGAITSHDQNIDLTHPEKYNFRYTISGHEDIAPIKIFDNGEFTYLQFRNQNTQIPAIFSVDEDLKEYMVNYHLSPTNANMVIIEQVYKKLSLRADKKILCIFNEGFFIK